MLPWFVVHVSGTVPMSTDHITVFNMNNLSSQEGVHVCAWRYLFFNVWILFCCLFVAVLPPHPTPHPTPSTMTKLGGSILESFVSLFGVSDFFPKIFSELRDIL